MKGVLLKESILLICPALDFDGQRVIQSVKTGQRFEIEISLTRVAPLSKALFHRLSLALRKLLPKFREQAHAATSRREIAFDLFIPDPPVAFSEPACQKCLVTWRELVDGFLDGFQGHISNLAGLWSGCKLRKRWTA